jgi:hypothetical protein
MDAVERTRSIFNENEEAMNAVSEDIVELERYFKECAVCTPFSYEAAPGLMLHWRPDGSKKFRLLCSYEREGRVAISGEPLISARAYVRAEAFPYLPEFVESFAGLLDRESKRRRGEGLV